MQRRINMDVCVVQSLDKILIHELSLHDRREVAHACARVEHLAFEVGFVLTNLVLKAGPDSDRWLTEFSNMTSSLKKAESRKSRSSTLDVAPRG